MSFEPQKFFVGLVDFFSIIMPGMFITYLGSDLVSSLGWESKLLQTADGSGWPVFFFVSYFLGHFVFLLGSVLDQKIYDPLRNCTDWGQTKKLALGKKLSEKRWRGWAKSSWLFGSKADAAVVQAERIKGRSLRGFSAENAINAFQWCKARLSIECPESLAMVQRFEADLKFFRSFVIALTIFGVIYLLSGNWLRALVCAGLCLLALWRYVDQRFKATQQAYWLIITQEGMKELSASPVPVFARPDGLTHAAGIVFRTRDRTVEYLLVQATKDQNEWVLPKGHIEAAEKPEVTAVREVKEESGSWARVVQRIGDVVLKTAKDDVPTRFFLMEFVEEGEADETRGCDWFALTQAKSVATFQDSKDLLDRAENLRAKLAAKTG